MACPGRRRAVCRTTDVRGRGDGEDKDAEQSQGLDQQGRGGGRVGEVVRQMPAAVAEIALQPDQVDDPEGEFEADDAEGDLRLPRGGADHVVLVLDVRAIHRRASASRVRSLP